MTTEKQAAMGAVEAKAELVAQVLGISQAGAYDLLHSEGFPVLKIGTRMVVPKEKFRQWVERNTRPES